MMITMIMILIPGPHRSYDSHNNQFHCFKVVSSEQSSIIFTGISNMNNEDNDNDSGPRHSYYRHNSVDSV